MTNFDFLNKDPRFASFAEVAAASENLLHIDVCACVINCRRAMEFAVKWMYSVDEALKMPSGDTLNVLMNEKPFKEIVGDELFERMDLIRKVGNNAAHDGSKVTEQEAELCLENLFCFLDFVAYCYSPSYENTAFDRKLLELTPEEAIAFVPDCAIDVEKLLRENAELKSELSSRRRKQQPDYKHKSLSDENYDVRKIYIDHMLTDQGWISGENRFDRVMLPGGETDEPLFADHVLYSDGGMAVAVVDAECTCHSFEEGRFHADRCADNLEREFGIRPLIFLTNGFETHIIDDVFPERRCGGVWNAEDLAEYLGSDTPD